MSKPLDIQQGFPDAARAQIAVLYDAAFGAKLGIAIPDAKLRLQILAEAFDPSHAFVAISGTQILGVAGFKSRHSSLTAGISSSMLRKRLGVFGWLRALSILALFERELGPDQLLMDGLCVAPEARGSGIGSQLLDRLKQFGAEEGYRTIRLDVIDTNPGARRLYERLGFAPRTSTHFAYLRWLLGFSAATTMEYRLAPAA